MYSCTVCQQRFWEDQLHDYGKHSKFKKYVTILLQNKIKSPKGFKGHLEVHALTYQTVSYLYNRLINKKSKIVMHSFMALLDRYTKSTHLNIESEKRNIMLYI